VSNFLRFDGPYPDRATNVRILVSIRELA